MTADVLDRPAVDVAAQVKAELEDAISRTFLAANAEHQRDPHSFSISSIGGCRKQGAFKLAGTPVSDIPPSTEGRAAVLGTMIHTQFLPRLAAEMGGEHEQPVTLRAGGLEIPGTLDIRVANGVFDLKTVADRRLHGLRRMGGDPYVDHEVQVGGYALAELQSGRPVDALAWLYMHRDRGDVEVVAKPVTNGTMAAVLDRVAEIKHYADTDPHSAPRDGWGPGKSPACNSCDWLKACWGDKAAAGRTGAQTILSHDVPGVEAALSGLDDASARRAAAGRDYDFWKTVVAGRPPGYYGQWSLRHGKDGRMLVRLTEALTKPMRAEVDKVEASWQTPDDEDAE